MSDLVEPDFNTWTEVIGSYFFSDPRNYGRSIALTCDTETLSESVKNFRDGAFTGVFSFDRGNFAVHQVKNQFFRTIHEWLKKSCCNWLPSGHVNGYPRILPLVAAQVLTVYEMKRRNGDMGQTPYWPCLEHLLGCDRCCNCIRKLRQDERHRRLWIKFREWVNGEKKRSVWIC